MKKFYWLKGVGLASVVFGVITCSNVSEDSSVGDFSGVDKNEYWFGGKAEISSYELKQARYGEIHEGNAVLVFVTEDFSRSKQVKLDDPNVNKADAIKVMKLNFTKKFHTGIYPYSMMSSTFTPFDYNAFPHTLKITTTSQEWCGHTFSQINYNDNKYDLQKFSYFETEGDVKKTIQGVKTEDELWNLIRIDPEMLPTGKVNLLPSSFYTRLRHVPFEPTKANITLKENPDNNSFLDYTIYYPSRERSIKITFNKSFPYVINSWEEKYESGWGDKKTTLTTTGKLKRRINLDYWNKNTNKDRAFIDELKLN